VQFQLRQGLAAGEFIVLDDEIAPLVIEPVRLIWLGERGYGNTDEGSGKQLRHE